MGYPADLLEAGADAAEPPEGVSAPDPPRPVGIELKARATRTLSIGKLRGLQQCADPGGAFILLALDHRQNLRRLHPMFASEAELVRFKVEVTRELAPSATGVLLDPEYGAAQAIAAGALPGDRGLVVALEATGYTPEATSERPRLLEGWSVEKAKRMGAQMAKLLVRYYPEAPGAGEVEALVARVAAECARFDLALMVEPLIAAGALSPEKNRAVVEAARRLSAIPGVNLLKVEFPASPEATDEEAAALCAELSTVSCVPWVLLSAAVDFETYRRQVKIACRAGASGVAVGRAVWQEAAQLSGPARLEFLRTVARERLERLRAVVRDLARPFTDFYTAEAALGWYRAY